MRQSFDRTSWFVSGLFALTFVLVPRLAAPQFYSFSGNPRNILEGNWQSCQESSTGRYTERIYDHVVNGIPQFEVHLGPRREFAMFMGVQDVDEYYDTLKNRGVYLAPPADEGWGGRFITLEDPDKYRLFFVSWSDEEGKQGFFERDSIA